MANKSKRAYDEAPTALRIIRKAAGLTQQELATAAGLNIRLIQKIEYGDADIGNITARNFLRLCKALNIEPQELLPEDPQEQE